MIDGTYHSVIGDLRERSDRIRELEALLSRVIDGGKFANYGKTLIEVRSSRSAIPELVRLPGTDFAVDRDGELYELHRSFTSNENDFFEKVQVSEITTNQCQALIELLKRCLDSP